jgi:hypothetical protein
VCGDLDGSMDRPGDQAARPRRERRTFSGDRMMREPRLVFGAERVGGWGMVAGGVAQVARPTTPGQVAAAMASVAGAHGSLGLRGAAHPRRGRDSGVPRAEAAPRSAAHPAERPVAAHRRVRMTIAAQRDPADVAYAIAAAPSSRK